MANRTNFTVFIAFNEHGEYRTSEDRDQAIEYLVDDCGASVIHTVEVNGSAAVPEVGNTVVNNVDAPAPIVPPSDVRDVTAS